MRDCVPIEVVGHPSTKQKPHFRYIAVSIQNIPGHHAHNFSRPLFHTLIVIHHIQIMQGRRFRCYGLVEVRFSSAMSTISKLRCR